MPNVLITGCSSGIGRALADAFKSAGFEVWASARREADVAALAAAGFNTVQLDVNDNAALQHLAEQWGELDVLINNAGYGAMGPLLDGGTAAMQRQFETNVFSIVGVTQALFPALRRGKGLVVNIGSVSGVLVTPFAGAYCASKAAVHALSDALRMELAPFGVRVMEVQPGAIDTSFAKNAGAQAELLINEKVAVVAVARRHSCAHPGLARQPDLSRALCRSSAEGGATVNTATVVARGQWQPGVAVDGGVVAQGVAGGGVEKALRPDGFTLTLS